MSGKQIYIFCAILITLLIISCEERDLLQTPNAKISKFENVILWLGDTLNYFGENFPAPNTSNYFLLKVDSDSSNNKIIPSEQANIWTHSRISLINNGSYNSGTISLIFAGDTSEARLVSFKKIPLLDTVEINSATFSMGYEFGELDEKPVHEVYLSNNLIVTKFEITQKIYSLVTGYNLSVINDLDLPVHTITWEDAASFCNELSLLYGFTEVYNLSGSSATINLEQSGWRLPTEAEWEYIAGAGNSDQFIGYSDLADGAWYNINSGFVPHEVGTKQPNSFGIYDILGNVAEYCTDGFISDFYSRTYSSTYSSTISGTFSAEIIATNPVAYSGDEIYVVRGGSSVQSDRYCRLTARSSSQKSNDGNFIGFRIVRTVLK
jgi:formylglycine-generating enzyme required for sulfatase activity